MKTTNIQLVGGCWWSCSIQLQQKHPIDTIDTKELIDTKTIVG